MPLIFDFIPTLDLGSLGDRTSSLPEGIHKQISGATYSSGCCVRPEDMSSFYSADVTILSPKDQLSKLMPSKKTFCGLWKLPGVA